MKIKPLQLEGCFEILLEPHFDWRGYFMRTYDQETFRAHGLTTDWVQENQSLTLEYGTIRGLHFQIPPFSETKLVRALLGSVMDVFVDLRKDSPTFRQWASVELSDSKFNLVYIPKGFAHGFCALSQNSIVSYHVDACYAPHAEGGLNWNDGDIKIEWPISAPKVSDKDLALPFLCQFDSPFTMSDIYHRSMPKTERAHV